MYLFYYSVVAVVEIRYHNVTTQHICNEFLFFSFFLSIFVEQMGNVSYINSFSLTNILRFCGINNFICRSEEKKKQS